MPGSTAPGSATHEGLKHGRTANGLTVHDPADERAARGELPDPPATVGKPRMFTRISAAWLGVWAGVVVVVLLIIFIGQNTAGVRIRFLWLDGTIPTALALLIAGVGGAVIAMAVSAARIVQLRRQVRHRP
jgi:putative membrane protein